MISIDTIRNTMAHGEVRFIDHRLSTPEPQRNHVVGVERTSDAAYDCAANVAQTASHSIGGYLIEAPGAVFQVWHGQQHVADVVAN